jgi:hypothetical protein
LRKQYRHRANYKPAELTDRVKQIYDAYANDTTYFDRIALVGCDTVNIKQGLARNFAKTIYDDIPELRSAKITGRGGEIEVNKDGTKTMKTGGTKTVYSWHDGGIVSATTGAKNTADALTNPLVNLNEEIQRLEELLESEKLYVMS